MSQKFSWVVRSAGAATAVGILIMAGVAYAQVPTLSQTSITVGLGQSTSVTSENGNDVYVELNSSPVTASVSVSGAQVTVTGEELGFSSVTLCAVGTASDCTNLSITVQATAMSSISFNPSSLSLSIGGNQPVTVTGGNGTYSVSSNTNTSVVSTNLSGNTLTVSGVAAGGATIDVCDTTGTTCGTISVTVGSSGTSGLSFSENNISLAPNGSQIVTVTGGNGTYNISGNSNSSDVSVGMSGSNAIIVDGLNSGSATITMCDTSNPSVCGTLSVTVTGSTSTATSNQAVVFSVTNPTLAVGQTLNVGLSGGASNYVLLSNGSAGVAQASISDSVTLVLTGVNAGTDSLTICATGGGCAALPVTVTGPASTVTTAPTTTTVAPTTTTTVTSPTSVVANTALFAEIQTLQSAVTQALTQIESIQSQLNELSAQVSAGSGAGISTSVSAGNSSSGTSYDFTELLMVGSEDSQVTALQNRLATLGFYSGPVTGYYGALTQSAVMKYQTSHGIAATGEVGPATRTDLNAGE